MFIIKTRIRLSNEQTRKHNGSQPRHHRLLLISWFLFLCCGFVNVAATTAAEQQEIRMGTTILALRYDEGIVVGADTRTSVSSYVSNRFANKIEYLFRGNNNSNNNNKNNAIVLCRSGSAADTQFLADELRWEFESRGLSLWNALPSVSQVAHYLRYRMLSSSNNNGGGLSASMIVAGYDHDSDHDGGGRGRIYSLAQTGALVEEDVYACSGSGSVFVMGFLDYHVSKMMNEGQTISKEEEEEEEDIVSNNDDKHLDAPSSSSLGLMTKEQAIEVISQALQLAMERDGSSGGFSRLVVLNKHGSEEMTILPPSSSSSSSSASSSSSSKTTLSGFAPPPSFVSRTSKR